MSNILAAAALWPAVAVNWQTIPAAPSSLAWLANIYFFQVISENYFEEVWKKKQVLHLRDAALSKKFWKFVQTSFH